MRKILTVFVAVFLLPIFTLPTFAKNRVLYHSDDSQTVITKNGKETILWFAVEIKYTSCGNLTDFTINKDASLDKIQITCGKPGTETNLTVFTKDSLQYTFEICDRTNMDNIEYDHLIDVYPFPEIDYRDLLNIVNKKTVEIDPGLLQQIMIYDTDSNRFDFNTNAAVSIYLKRVVTCAVKNKTVFWFRICNNFTEASKIKDTTLGVTQNFTIQPTKISMKDREWYATAIEVNKEKLKPGEFVDIYFIVNGAYPPDNSLNLLLSINGQSNTYTLTNIPYHNQEFKVFTAGEKSYQSVILEDYRR